MPESSGTNDFPCKLKTMKLTVDIDANSGFCAGVTRAIKKAEEQLEGPEGRLYSLGAIVHNDAELSRLEAKGLVTIDKEDLEDMQDAHGETLLIRAHGEPPATYRKARQVHFKIIDCTCPVVLKLQESIREAYSGIKDGSTDGQIIIFGKIGHAEVLGLVGQAEGNALVVENLKMLEDAVAEKRIDLKKHVEIFSQTTKNPAEYSSLCTRLEEMMAKENELPMQRFAGRGLLKVHNTICSQVATRHARLSKFAIEHDILIFVAGKASSNGKVLCDRCKSLNIRTYHIETPDEIRKEWFRDDDKVGVCGAASTPKWLLEDIANNILAFNSED